MVPLNLYIYNVAQREHPYLDARLDLQQGQKGQTVGAQIGKMLYTRYDVK